ncbi:MAG: peptidylprolyl isomerase [Prevotellaceae bacterium]|jgi:peptidyl-prolyl cis-trans isomerase B (cyclophilin B)|nr:peptidylprolyl isomerase [Prevotellaceae bacterium]
MKTKVLILLLTATLFMNCNAQPVGSSFDPKSLGASPELVIETTSGNITVKLYAETPQHRDNFLKLASTGYYDGVIFHRVIARFMIQTGDPDSKQPEKGKMYGMGGPKERIPAEIIPGRYHKKGALAAARDNNPQKASSGSQFYMVQGNVFTLDELARYEQQRGQPLTPEQTALYTTVGGAPWLDGEYTVFGEVTEGLEIIDRIAAVAKDRNDRPLDDIFILRIMPK